MKILGINRTQEASISFFSNGEHIFSIQKERITGKKHHWGKIGDIALYKKYYPELKEPVDLIVQCFSSDDELIKLQEYIEEIFKEGLANDQTPILQIPHHLAHLYSIYPYTRFEGYAVIILDAIGSMITESTEDFPEKQSRLGQFEIASFYMCRSNNYHCFKKHTISKKERKSFGLGKFYSYLRKALFPGEGNEGKVMGLAAYGNKDQFKKYPSLIVENGEVSIPGELITLLTTETYLFANTNTSFQEKADLAAFGQYLFEEALFKLVDWVHTETGMKKIAYAGGCALNCVANGKLKERYPYLEIYIPPAPNDAGTSVGCAIYGNYMLNLDIKFKWTSDYLGAPVKHDHNEILAACHEAGLDVTEMSHIEDCIANLIIRGYIVSVYQNNSEFGPRALGNRSIICDSRYAILKHFINGNIKGREWFRPIAPIVLEEDAGNFFVNGCRSTHMLYCFEVREQFKNKFCAIEHPDNHMRVQTITEQDNPLLYKLLKTLKAQGNLPLIANTSFNGPDETIVETFEDALNCFLKYPIHYLVVPPFLIRKRGTINSILNYKSSFEWYT